MVAPVLPQYARHFGVSISAATFVITAFALMRLVAAPPAGLLVQRLGERRVYISGLVIVALSTGACAFAQTYWQLLLFRSFGGLGSAMFTVSSLGLMIRISPPDARGRVAGMFSSGFLIGSVGGPVLGSLTAGLGLAAPFVIYGAALLVAAAVVFVSLRNSAVALPEATTEPAVSVRTVLRHRAYRAALFSNFATGWAAFGLRIALVPLFVVEVLGYGAGLRGTGAGDVRDRQHLGRHPQRISVRPGRAPQAADRRPDGVGGLDGAGRLHVLAAGVPGGGLRHGRGHRRLRLSAAGRGGRHRREQVARAERRSRRSR